MKECTDLKKDQDEEALFKLTQVKWKKPLSQRLSEFSELIKDDKTFNKYFGQSYVDELAIKIKALTKFKIKVILAYSALMTTLFMSQYIEETEFQVLGFGFKNISSFKEYILIAAVTLLPLSSFCKAYEAYLNGLILECLKKSHQIKKPEIITL